MCREHIDPRDGGQIHPEESVEMRAQVEGWFVAARLPPNGRGGRRGRAGMALVFQTIQRGVEGAGRVFWGLPEGGVDAFSKAADKPYPSVRP
jgi:hypothetical protein